MAVAVAAVAVLCFAVSAQAATTVVAVPFQSSGWKYNVVGVGAGAGFQAVGYDDSGFSAGTAGFGSLNDRCPWNNASQVHTFWPVNTDLLLRRSINLPADASNLRVEGTVDNDATAYVNGQQIGSVQSGNCDSPNINFGAPDSALVAGGNVLAIRGSDYGDDSFLDVRVTYQVPHCTLVRAEVKLLGRPTVICLLSE